ncbi:hypothetical protein [Streptomyces fulvoviolaceus]|uniref:hypothetical protein n=1 Tax=Streptomyces fulvoviolaceus TaxID=285535 RepID=UPI0021BE01D7|nr:hypothetical protein [Streptomyces fulvoviolaceus]MCT9076986.1 hypothetical protein [Streptomyces fulvoviolaceus]
MTRVRRLRRRIAVILPMMAALLLISTQSAQATDYQNLWDWTKKTYVITHEWDYVNTTGENHEWTITKEHIDTVTGAIDASGGATGNLGSKFFGQLGIEVGLSLHGSGTRTNTESITIKITIPKADGKYVYYSGTRKASGRYERWGCSSQRCSVVGYKKGHSWTSNSHGSISCKKAALDGLSKKVKKVYC